MSAPQILGEYTIIDDCGVIGIADPDAYPAFIRANASADEVTVHFLEQATQSHLILWRTGREEEWRILVQEGKSEATPFREFQQGILLSSGTLCLYSYETLVGNAESEVDSLLWRSDATCAVEPGFYWCRILQMYDPQDLKYDVRTRCYDFILELQWGEYASGTGTPVTEIPWGDGYLYDEIVSRH